jgi:hypothetical protein
MTEHRPGPTGTTFTGLFAIELLVALAVIVVATILVRLDAISLKTLQDYFG